MKFTLRIIACILALLLSVGGLLSCDNDGDDYDDGMLEDESGEDESLEENGDGDESESGTKKQEADNPNKILAKELSSYKFVISDDATDSIRQAAEGVCAIAKDKWNTDGVLNTDDYAYATKEKREILIGQTNRTESKKYMNSLRENQGGFGVYGSKIAIGGYSEEDMLLALNMFCSDIILGMSTRKTVFLTSNDNVKTDLSEYVSIMSFNVYVGIESDEAKKAGAINMIRTFNPDVFGVQEASVKWQTTLKNEFSDDYYIVGVGRDGNGNGEAMLIFARKSRFEIKSSGTKWLTSTPDKVSKVEFSACNRVATYAVIERKRDGKIFNYINTHLDHEGGRDAQVGYLCDIIENNTQSGAPTFVSGDFNDFPETEVISAVKTAGYTPSYELAQKNCSDGVGTFGNFGAIIDYIFVKNGTGATTHLYKVCNDNFFGQSSDHYPIFTVFKF